MSKKTLLLVSLAGLPLASVAQTAPASSHFYIGAGVNLLTNVPFGSVGVPRLVGPSLTAGVSLSPRVAVQASAAYHWQSHSNGSSYNSGGIIYYDDYSTSYKYFTVPVLLRYTFTPNPERFRFDGLVGVTVLYSRYHYTSTSTYSGTPYSSESTSGSTRANITLGPAVRYAAGSNVELTANGLVSAIVGDSYRSFSDRLFLNVLVGAQYSFGH